MSEKLFICKRGWVRHSKGAIINEWEWKKLAIESRESFFEPYNPEPAVEPSPAVVEFGESLKKELETRGIKTETKYNKKNEVDVSFKFEGNEE